MTKNKTIFITGAAGSVGEALVNSFFNWTGLTLILLDRNENALYFLKEKNKKNKTKITYLIGDIQDKGKLNYIFAENKIDYVIHCAAYKQVPIMESNLYEIIKNNIEGLINVINVSKNFEVEKFLFISSDKAVYPSSLMGLSKRVGEVIVEKINQETPKLQLLSLRFSNLLGSNGSVLPLFEEQFKLYNKIFLTTEKAKRYFITSDLLSDLVISALDYKGNNSLLVGDFEKEIYVKEIAKSFLENKGLNNYQDYIENVGLRSGEKNNESLIYKFENRVKLKGAKLSEVKMNINISNDFINMISDLIAKNSPENENVSNVFLKNLMKDYLITV